MSSTITDGSTTYTFEFWNGEQPVLLSEHVQQFSRAGADGLAHRKLGTRGRSFTAELTSHHASYAAARSSFATMLAFVGKVVDIVHEGRNLNSADGVSFVVEAVESVECQSCVLLTGPGYAYAGGARLVTRWQLAAIDKDLV